MNLCLCVQSRIRALGELLSQRGGAARGRPPGVLLIGGGVPIGIPTRLNFGLRGGPEQNQQSQTQGQAKSQYTPPPLLPSGLAFLQVRPEPQLETGRGASLGQLAQLITDLSHTVHRGLAGRALQGMQLHSLGLLQAGFTFYVVGQVLYKLFTPQCNNNLLRMVV